MYFETSLSQTVHSEIILVHALSIMFGLNKFINWKSTNLSFYLSHFYQRRVNLTFNFVEIGLYKDSYNATEDDDFIEFNNILKCSQEINLLPFLDDIYQ